MEQQASETCKVILAHYTMPSNTHLWKAGSGAENKFVSFSPSHTNTDPLSVEDKGTHQIICLNVSELTPVKLGHKALPAGWKLEKELFSKTDFVA